MCGIAGFTGERDDALLRRMTDSIRYRGPDDERFFSNGSVNFGFRRLSIIDLTTGAQPVASANGKIVVIFNGEIYNFLELKDAYLAGMRFATKGDTEVIVYLYARFGERFVDYLNGMFSIALWDDEKKILILARDRMGKKPLYYTMRNDRLFFASEVKALLAVLPSKPAVNLAATRRYLQFQYLLGPDSIFEGIHKVPPAHYLRWHNGRHEMKRYWTLNFGGGSDNRPEVFGALLEDAVKKRLMADVPLGIFLSGGIDSSTVTYFAAKHSLKRVKTFSIGFQEKSFDESRYSNLVAKHLNTDHHHAVFSHHDLLDVLPAVFALQDEPLADASILPTYLLSRYTRRDVTVALGGDGADELFGGYPTFLAHRLADAYRFVPSPLRDLIAAAAARLPVSHGNFSLDFRLKQFLKGARERGYRRDILWTSAFTPDEQQALLQPELRADAATASSEALPEFFGTGRGGRDEILRFWQTGYLVDDILVKVDRASMYNSLEVRAPFLDYRVVEYVNNLPYAAKMRGLVTKYLLKQVMKDKLPRAVVSRPKKGFGIPLSHWLNHELQDLVEESLGERRLRETGVLEPGYVRRLVREHRDRRHDHRMKLWTLIVFMQWHKHWVA